MSPSNNTSPYMKMIQYEIKMIKVSSLKACYFCTVHQDRYILTGCTNPQLKCLWQPFVWCCQPSFDLFDYLSLCRCLKVLTKPRISSMCTRQSFPRCVVSNWTTTIKQGICSQVSVCATLLTLGRIKTTENQKQTKCSFVYLHFWQEQTAVKKFVFLKGFMFQVGNLTKMQIISQELLTLTSMSWVKSQAVQTYLLLQPEWWRYTDFTFNYLSAWWQF